jgi:ethanolamine utilization microcompartment shell protein EutS
LANNTRKKLLENSMYQLNPYETLSVPILRVFYPKFVAKDAVTVSPIDKPDVIKGFLRATFTKHNDPNIYPAPAVRDDISGGPEISTPAGSEVAVPSSTDVLAMIGLTADVAHLQKDFLIYKVIDGGGNEAEVNITPTVDGTIAGDVEINGVSDTILGYVDFLNGVVELSSTQGVIKKAAFTVTTSMEENIINPKVRLTIEKIRLIVTDRQISAEWSLQMEQDTKALFDLDIQSEIVSIIGQQVALDLDRQIINTLLASVQNPILVPSTHVDTFSKTPPPSYTWGPKMWYENILPKLNKLSAQVYHDTNIDAANTILCNPLDASILESLEEFHYTGSSVENGELGYRTASISGKWTVLVSSVVPKGKMQLIYKPVEEMKTVFIHCPYVPAVLSPYPLGPVPSLTVLSRNANSLIRPHGLALLNVVD